MSKPMMTIRILVLLAAMLQIGCGASKPPPVAGPAGVRSIAVDPVANRTGDTLVLTDPGLLGRLLDEQRASVPALLRSDLRAALTDRGFDVVAEAGHGTPALHIELRRWAPYTADYSMVMVNLVATIIEHPSGREVWRHERVGWRVSTPDARSSYEASVMAAERAAQDVVKDWRPRD